MKTVSILLLLCSAASALEPPRRTCHMENTAAAKLAVDHINEHHHHGYKFKETDVHVYEIDPAEEHCVMKMKLNLTETKCHVINPKPYEDCEMREDNETHVVANCTVEINVKDNEGRVNKYDCLTRKVRVDGCPDCPVLTELTEPTGQFSVSRAVAHFNRNTRNRHYYTLQEIGRISLGYMFAAGMGFFAEFALVETHCPRETNMKPEACEPLCPDRAHRALCKSRFTTVGGLRSVDCEYYPPQNTSPLEREPVCPHPGGLLPHTGFDVHPHCHGLPKYDHALHPICPWPVQH